jgi:hypothetical protein
MCWRVFIMSQSFRATSVVATSFFLMIKIAGVSGDLCNTEKLGYEYKGYISEWILK